MIARTLLALAILSATHSAYAQTCTVELAGDDAMKFNTAEIKVDAACTEVTVNLKHVGKLPVSTMGHNFVLTRSADVNPVAVAGASQKDNQYVPKDEARVLASTKVIGGGESTAVTFRTDKLQKGGDYTYFCSFPGHWALMKGKFVFG